MAYPKPRRAFHPVHLRTSRHSRPSVGYSGARSEPIFLLLFLFLLAVLIGIFVLRDQFKTRLRVSQHGAARPDSARPLTLFIAIGSGPGNALLRAAAREGWLRWLPSDGSVQYRFFSDARPAAVAPSDDPTWDALEREAAEHGDIVLQPLESGYGNAGDNAYGRRAQFQMRWARAEWKAGFEYLLRVDDDSFLCAHRLLYELKTAPRTQFFWGRFWCREGRNRADENFMLFSEDLTRLLTDEAYVGRLLPFDDRVTLGWNFGYWSWMLNLTIFDDQERIDAQQGYLTEYMHRNGKEGGMQERDAEIGRFCDSHIFAHHVSAEISLKAYAAARTRTMYGLPRRTGPRETCPWDTQSFVPARHSARLPNVRISGAL